MRTLLTLAPLCLAACVSNNNDSSVLKIRFPEAPSESSQQGKLSSASISDFAWSKVCFAANVTAADLTKQAGSPCDVPTGVFVGTATPGSEIAIDVPRGTNRKLEIFAFVRASSNDPCPTLKGGFQGLDRSRIARVGSVPSFDAIDPVVNLTVDLSAPGADTDLISQYQLASTCRAPASVDEIPPAHATLGSAQQSGGRFTVLGSVSAHKNQGALSGGKYQIQLNRKAE